MAALSIIPLTGIGEIQPGEALAATLSAAIRRAGVHLTSHDILVVAQKAVSKAENRYVDLNQVSVSPEAMRLAEVTRKDPRLVQLVLTESSEVLRSKPEVLIVRHRLGYVMANAGID